MTRIAIGCLGVVALLLIAGAAFVFFGPDVSIPWAETRVVLPGGAGDFLYRQKGVHRARVTLKHGARPEDHWLPWRARARPVNVYYYPRGETGDKVRLEDQWSEVLIDLQKAKTYLLVKTPDEQVFAGEILADEVSSSSGSVNGGPWEVKIGDRKAENITSSGILTNRGQYVGRIEVTESRGSALDPPAVRFISLQEGPELVIKRDE